MERSTVWRCRKTQCKRQGFGVSERFSLHHTVEPLRALPSRSENWLRVASRTGSSQGEGRGQAECQVGPTQSAQHPRYIAFLHFLRLLCWLLLYLDSGLLKCATKQTEKKNNKKSSQGSMAKKNKYCVHCSMPFYTRTSAFTEIGTHGSAGANPQPVMRDDKDLGGVLLFDCTGFGP